MKTSTSTAFVGIPHPHKRSNGRAGPYHGRRGRGLSPPPLRPMPDRGDHKLFPPLPYTDCGDDHDGYRRREPYAPVRDRSPIRREALTPVSSGSNNNSSRSYSPERDKAYTYQQLQQRRYEDTHSRNREPDKPKASTSHTSSGSGDESSHSSVLIKENPAASVTESEEVVAAANTKPKLTPEEDFKARRAQAIADKALQVEELYRRDCQTFATVVKMLVAKKPSLDQLLQGPMKENLMEIKQRCLDDLKQFIKELDQVKMPEAST
ncbi:periphilin-1 isoform 2-T2 [Polymixia lowei]